MRYRLDPQRVLWQTVEGELVAVDLESSTYLAANPTATTLWPLLVAGAEVNELVDALTSAFEIDADTARADVTAFVAGLSDRGVLVPAPV